MELIGRADVDLVDVCTPPSTHAAVVLAAARNPKHVICEKPLATSVNDARQIEAAVHEAGVLGAMVHNFLFLPEVARAMALIASGAIGVPRIVSLDWMGIVESRSKSRSRNWRRDPALSGGGVLMDMIHALYVAEALLGEPFVQVSAQTRPSRASSLAEDLIACRFEGRQGMAIVSLAWGVGAASITVSGSDGWLQLTHSPGGSADFDRGDHLTLGRGGTVTREEDARDPHAYAHSFEAVFQNVAAAIHAGLRPAADIRDGRHTLEAAMAAYRSAESGRLEPIGSVGGPVPK